MDMFPHVVTIYSVVIEMDPDTLREDTKNYITVLNGVLLDAVKAKNVNQSGLTGADAVTLYIPLYAGPVEFWRAEDKSGLWTLSAGGNTFFVKGRAVHPDWSVQKIEAAYDDVYDITKVDFKDFGGDMSHWEVGGA